MTLDGKPFNDLRYEISSDPRTERPALLAMIDVRELARGRHEIRIARPPRTDRNPDKDDPDPGYDQIPFWKIMMLATLRCSGLKSRRERHAATQHD